jgi:protein TonB
VSPAERRPRPPSLPRALALAGAAVAIAVTIFLVALAARAQRSGTPPTELLGSQLPQGWEPGSGGVGNAPPQPLGLPSPPAGGAPAPPPPPPVPLGQPQARYPGAESLPPMPGEPDASLPPGVEPATPPPVVAEAPPEPVDAYTPPRLVDLPAPAYPRVGQRMGMEATVVLRVRVSSRGRVLEAEPIGAEVGYGFEAEAMRAARRARFEPAVRNGEPVSADARLAVKFRLNR